MPSSRSKVTPRKTANDLSVFVNTDRIRSSIKRLFHNNIAEVLSEIFQNSQRAGAKNVQITITSDGFSITDDGHGLIRGIDAFRTLLKLDDRSGCSCCRRSHLSAESRLRNQRRRVAAAGTRFGIDFPPLNTVARI